MVTLLEAGPLGSRTKLPAGVATNTPLSSLTLGPYDVP